jgi:hypothetical protein|tara:strand:+ start:154 stop:420 length:267 start_codon:yes stop_codon:yes gene_type:complete
MKWNVIELDVDEIEECLIMRCSTFESADYLCSLFLDHFPLAQFAVSQRTPAIHIKDYNPERYKELRKLILSKEESTKPNLIVIDGGKE